MRLKPFCNGYERKSTNESYVNKDMQLQLQHTGRCNKLILEGICV